MDRIVPFADRPRSQQVLAAVAAPIVFGVIAGFVLGASATVYWVLQAIGAIGGILASMEHPSARQAALRCGIGGLLYGTFLIVAHEISGAEPEVDIGDSDVGLIVVTTLAGALIGAVGGVLRRRSVRRRARLAGSN